MINNFGQLYLDGWNKGFGNCASYYIRCKTNRAFESKNIILAVKLDGSTLTCSIYGTIIYLPGNPEEERSAVSLWPQAQVNFGYAAAYWSRTHQ